MGISPERRLRPAVDELHLHAEVLPLQQLDDRLEVVGALPGHAHLLVLDLGLDLELRLLDDGDDLLPLLRGDPLLDGDHLADAAAGGGLRLPVLERLEGDPALHELRLEDVDDRLQPEVVVGQHLDPVLVLRDLRLRPLEVVPLADLLDRLVDRVVDLLQVHDRYDVERRHPLPSPLFPASVPPRSHENAKKVSSYQRTREGCAWRSARSGSGSTCWTTSCSASSTSGRGWPSRSGGGRRRRGCRSTTRPGRSGSSRG